MRSPPSSRPLVVGAFFRRWHGGDIADPATTNQLPALGQRYIEELKKPDYGVSRCSITPVFSSDGITVAISGDRLFSAGDVVISIGGSLADPIAKSPIRVLLMKHGPAESLEVKIRRANKEIVVTATCSDAKPGFDLFLEAAYAASRNDALTCADKMDAVARLHMLYYSQRALAYQCYRSARRFSSVADGLRSAYEMYRELILESAWSSDALGNIRGTILTVVDTLQKNNASMLADDLRQQYEQAVSAKLSPTTAATTESR